MSLLFETTGLCKSYRTGRPDVVSALADVSVGIAAGSFTVVTGPSGSGKTTLLALLGALERLTRGRILFDGRDLGNCSDVELARIRRRMGFVFQDFSLIPNLSAEDNIAYPLIPRGVVRAERRRRAKEWLARLGMESKLLVRAGDLSGGEQQRVGVARALAGQPDVLLADEPTSNLDRDTSRTLLTLFQELHRQGKTIILTSHDPQVVSLATCVHELVGGRIQKRTED